MSREMREHLLDLPHYLTEFGKNGTLVKLLTDFGFIEAKCASGMAIELQHDYERALLLWPEGRQEKERKESYDQRLSRYSYNLAEYPGGYVQEDFRVKLKSGSPKSGEHKLLPEPPPSVCSPAYDQSASPTNKKITRPMSYSTLRAFSEYVHRQYHALAQYGFWKVFSAQQAYNMEFNGPVYERAQNRLKELDEPFVVRRSRPEYPDLPYYQALRTMEGHSDDTRCLVMTPDAKYAVSGGDRRSLCLWDLQSGKYQFKLFGQPDRIFSVSMTPDCRMAVSGDWSGWICVWDLENRKLLRTFKAHKGAIFSVSMTPDGRRAASGGEDRIIHVWDLKTGKRVNTLSHNDIGQVLTLAMSADGQVVMSGHEWEFESDRKTIRNLLNVWNVQKEQLVHSFWQFSTVDCLDITPDGKKLITGDCKGNITVWNLGVEKPAWRTMGHNQVAGISIACDGNSGISMGADGIIKLWDLKDGLNTSLIRTPHIGTVHSIATSADCRFVISAGLLDANLRLWDLTSCANDKLQEGHEKRIQEVFLDVKRNRVISKGTDGAICLWDADSCRQIRKRNYAVGLASHLDFNLASGVVACANHDKGMFVSALGSDESADFMPEIDSSDYYWSAVMAPDGNCVVAAKAGGVVEIWNMRTGTKLFSHCRGSHMNCSVNISPDGCFVYLRVGSIWRKLDLSEGALALTSVNLPNTNISPDGRLALCQTDDNCLRVYDLATTMCVKELRCEIGDLDHTMFSFKGDKVLFGKSTLQGSSFGVWNLRDDNSVVSSSQHHGHLTGLTATCDDQYVVSVSRDNTLRVWDAENCKCTGVYYAPEGLNCVTRISVDGHVAVGTDSGIVDVLGLQGLQLGVPIVTAVRLWRLEGEGLKGRWDERLTVLCPRCGSRMPVSKDIVSTIDGITKNCSLSPEAIPSMDLPAEAWREEALVSICRECGQDIQYNPFAVDNKNVQRIQCTVSRSKARANFAQNGAT